MPPQMQVKTNMDFEILEQGGSDNMTGDREEMFSKLEQDISQVKMCMTNRTYLKRLETLQVPIKSLSRWLLHSKKRSGCTRFILSKEGTLFQSFHMRPELSRVVGNTDLMDNDLEAEHINGINYVVKNPKGC